MTKFNNNSLFFSVLFLAGTFSITISLGNNALNTNLSKAYAETKYSMTCQNQQTCVLEELLPENSTKAPEDGAPTSPKDKHETRATTEAPNSESPEENPNCSADNNSREIIEPEYRSIFDALSGELPEYEEDTCVEEPISERGKETTEIEFEEPSATVVEVNMYDVIADPEYLPKPKNEDRVEKDILEIATEKKHEKDQKLNTSNIFIPKAPNTGRP